MEIINTTKELFIWGELAQLRSRAKLGEVIFIPRSYGIFYLTTKSLLRHYKKIVLISWLLSGKFYIFIMDSRRLQQFHFTVYSDHCFFYSFATWWDFTYISFTYIRFCLSGSTRRSHVEIEFWKNSKTCACALKKNLSHLAGLPHLHMFIWQIFISPWWDPGKIKWDPP